ncbi:MAG TPA: hypothetical protein VF145_11590, partial [Chitinophagaceae bacterium]
MTNRYNSFFQFVFTFVDLWGINLVYFAAMFMMNSVSNTFDSSYIALILVYNIAWMLSGATTSLYINSNSYRTSVLGRHTTQAFVFFLLLVSCFLYFGPFSYPWKFTLASLGGFAFALVLSRLLYLAAVKVVRIHEKFVRKVVIIGYNDAAKNLVEHHLSTSRNIAV